MLCPLVPPVQFEEWDGALSPRPTRAVCAAVGYNVTHKEAVKYEKEIDY